MKKQPATPARPRGRDRPKLRHELEVHQIELEMQNEQLRSAQFEIEAGLARYTDLYEFAPVGYLNLDAGGAILLANLNGAGLLGAVRSRLVGRRFAEFVAPADRPVFAQCLARVFAGKTKQSCELALATGTSPVTTVRLKATLAPDGRECHVALIDLTERIRAEAVLRESEARLAGLVGSAMDAIVSIDAAQRIVLFNAAAERMFGYPADQIIGRPLDLLLPDQFRAGHAPLVGKFARSGVTARRMGALGRISGRRAHGEEFPIEASISQVDLAGSRLFTVILRDITDRERDQAELAAERDRSRTLARRLLEVQETERRQIARDLHDELGQTLTAVKINLQTQAMSTHVPLAPSVALVDRALQQTRALSLALRPPLLDDLGLASALRWLVDQQAQQTGQPITLTTDLPAERPSPTVETACFRIAQEALTNALRHGHATAVTLAVATKDGKLILTVRDDGAGFDLAAIRARALRGGSLGLLGMEERASLAGGRVEWRTTLGAGTEVYAWFPLSSPPAGEEQTNA